MAANGVAFTESIVHAPVSNQGAYAYRSRLGMMGSAEFAVFMDDFIAPVASNVPNGWSAAIIDTGATTTTYTTALAGARGILQISDATASEGAAFYGAKSIQFEAGKKFFVECRIYTDDVTDNAIQFGLTDLTAVTNPEDIWTTVAANLITFGILDGAATTGMLSDKANSGTSVQTGTLSVTASTWTTLAIGYDGTSLKGYVNGYPSLTWSSASTTIPTGTALAPFVGALNGNGAGGNTNLIDYFRIAVER